MLKQLSDIKSIGFSSLFILLSVGAFKVPAQIRLKPVTSIGNTITCHVGPTSYQLEPDQSLISGKSNHGNGTAETQAIFDKVVKHTQLRSNVYTVPVRDDINVEICPGEVHYIAYNPHWLKALYAETNNVWVLYAVIAHEIGHYALNHDRTAVRSDPKIELEADKYAGETLARMGAHLEDAQAVFKSGKIDTPGYAHPPIEQRIAAVTEGWREVRGTESANVQVSPIKVEVSPITVNVTTISPAKQLRDSVYKGDEDKSLTFRFKALAVDYNSDKDLTETAGSITRSSGTHVWDNTLHYWTKPAPKSNLLLAWRNIKTKTYSWVVVQNYKGHWYYKPNGGEWKLIEQGAPQTTVQWTSSGQKIRIYLCAPKVSSVWTIDDIQYGFG